MGLFEYQGRIFSPLGRTVTTRANDPLCKLRRRKERYLVSGAAPVMVDRSFVRSQLLS
jgi:hypothetical protein